MGCVVRSRGARWRTPPSSSQTRTLSPVDVDDFSISAVANDSSRSFAVSTSISTPSTRRLSSAIVIRVSACSSDLPAASAAPSRTLRVAISSSIAFSREFWERSSSSVFESSFRLTAS